MNPSKRSVMCFGSGRALDSSAVYWMGGVALKYVESSRDLGVIMDNKLRFHSHVNLIVGKAGGLMNALFRTTVCRSVEFMTSLFVSNIRPLMDYCSPVWNVGFLMDVRKLESVQRRWSREVEGLREVEYTERLRRLGLFSIQGRLLRADLLKVWKIFHRNLDERLVGLFEMARERRTRGHQFKMSIPICRTEVKTRSFGVRCVEEWNALPSEIVMSSSLELFKSRIDCYLSEKFFMVC